MLRVLQNSRYPYSRYRDLISKVKTDKGVKVKLIKRFKQLFFNISNTDIVLCITNTLKYLWHLQCRHAANWVKWVFKLLYISQAKPIVIFFLLKKALGNDSNKYNTPQKIVNIRAWFKINTRIGCSAEHLCHLLKLFQKRRKTKKVLKVNLWLSVMFFL